MTLRLIRPDEMPEEPAGPVFVPVDALGGRNLAWRRVRGHEGHELWQDESLVATLRPEASELRRVRGESAAGALSLAASGTSWKRVVLYDEVGRSMGTFRERWIGGGTLQLSNGIAFKLSPANLWRSEWIWRDASAQEVLHWQHWEQRVTPAGRGTKATIVLMTLSWYLHLLAAEAGRAGANLSFLDDGDE